MSKKKSTANGIVYSTDPSFSPEQDNENTPATLLPEKQNLRIRYETKHRAGKAVTIVDNFVGGVEDLERLGKQLKAHCGTGGSVKDGQVIIQGDHRQKALQWLLKNNYRNSR